MADGKQFYTGKELTAIYSATSPRLPQENKSKILRFLSKKLDLKECVAVDVGCGSGQSAIPLAPHLKHIAGIDVSQDQINEGNRNNTFPNVVYKVGFAEKLPFPDASVHLVLATTAAHWFDMVAFLKETDRVLVPSGVLAISSATFFWSSDDGCGDTELPTVTDLADDINDAYWPTVTKILTMFESIELPYASAARKDIFFVPEKMTVASIMNRVESIAGVSKFLKDKPEKAKARLQNFQERFMKYVDSKSTPEETEVTIKSLHILCLTRKPDA